MKFAAQYTKETDLHAETLHGLTLEADSLANAEAISPKGVTVLGTIWGQNQLKADD